MVVTESGRVKLKGNGGKLYLAFIVVGVQARYWYKPFKKAEDAEKFSDQWRKRVERLHA